MFTRLSGYGSVNNRKGSDSRPTHSPNYIKNHVPSVQILDAKRQVGVGLETLLGGALDAFFSYEPVEDYLDRIMRKR